MLFKLKENEREGGRGIGGICLALIDTISFSVWLVHKDSKALPSSFSHLARVVIFQSFVLYMVGLSQSVCIREHVCVWV